MSCHDLVSTDANVKAYGVFFSTMCPSRSNSDAAMRGVWGCSEVDQLLCGHILPADSHRTGWTRRQLQRFS